MRMFKDDSGLSLTELLVVCALLGIVLAVVYLLMGSAQAMTDSTTARAIAADESQRAIDRMSLDIRAAQENQLQYGAVLMAQPNELKLFVNSNNGGRPQLVRYYVSGGSLWRSAYLASNATTPTDLSAAGWTFSSTPSTNAKIVQNLVTSNGDLFCYHDRVSNATLVCTGGQKHGFDSVPAAVLSTPLNNDTAKPKISMIGINLTNTQTSGPRTAVIRSNVLVRVRSIDNDTN